MHLVCLMEVDSRQPEHRTFITNPLQFSRHINRQWKSDHRRQHFLAYLDCIQLKISLCYILLYLSHFGSGYLLLHIPQGDWTTYKYYMSRPDTSHAHYYHHLRSALHINPSHISMYIHSHNKIGLRPTNQLVNLLQN